MDLKRIGKAALLCSCHGSIFYMKMMLRALEAPKVPITTALPLQRQTAVQTPALKVSSIQICVSTHRYQPNKLSG